MGDRRHHRYCGQPGDTDPASGVGVGRLDDHRVDRDVTPVAEGEAPRVAARVSITYWRPNHDTCTASCTTRWELSDEERQAGWTRFVDAPAPVGYDPSIVPGWTSPLAPGFGILRLEPVALRVMDGSAMVGGAGRRLSWKR